MNLLGLAALGGLGYLAVKHRQNKPQAPDPLANGKNGPAFYTHTRPMCGLVNPIAGSGQIQEQLGQPAVHTPGNNFAGHVVLQPNAMRVPVGRFWPASGDMNPITGEYTGTH